MRETEKRVKGNGGKGREEDGQTNVQNPTSKCLLNEEFARCVWDSPYKMNGTWELKNGYW
jgi:hypothetical protein